MTIRTFTGTATPLAPRPSASKRSITIFHKLLITLLGATLFPLCALWYLDSTSAKSSLTAHIEHKLVTAADTLATRITGWDEINVRTLDFAARLEDVISMKAERQNPVLKAIAATHEWSYLTFTVAPDGTNIGRNDGKEPVNFADRLYFKSVMRGEAIGRQVVIGKTSGKPALIMARPVRNHQSELLGVIAMSITLGDISKSVTDMRIGETGRAILLDASKKVIAHGVSSTTRQVLHDMGAHPALHAPGSSKQPVLYIGENGAEMIGFVRALPQGWTLLVEQEVDEAFAPLKKMEDEARSLILVMMALVAGLAFFLARRLTRPINELTAIAARLSIGELGVRIPQTGRRDEIGTLAQAIERLGISIHMAMDRLRRQS